MGKTKKKNNRSDNEQNVKTKTTERKKNNYNDSHIVVKEATSTYRCID